MTTPAQKSSIHSRKGWAYLTNTLSRHLPWSLTHAGNAYKAVGKLTGRK